MRNDTKKESRIEKEIGNVTSESAFTVEYGVRKKMKCQLKI